MARANGKQVAALRREAAKRGEELPPKAACNDPEIASDPTYVPPKEFLVMEVPVPNAVDPAEKKDELIRKRKERLENADILPERQTKVSKTTQWRNENGKTKKARAVTMQHSIAAVFAKRSNPDPKEVVYAPQCDQDDDIQEVERPEGLIPGIEILPDAGVSTNGDDACESEVQEVTEVTSTVNIEDSEPSSEATNVADGCNSDSGAVIVDREDHSEATAKRDHQKLSRLVEKLDAQYRKKRHLLTDDNAARRLLDLEAIKQYNNQRLKLFEKRTALKARLKSSVRIARQRIQKQINNIRPSMDASTDVARRLGKGPYYARVLRSMAKELLTTGRLPEATQGKGATHASHLLDPRVSSALREWVKGLLPEDKGGFDGPINPMKLRRYVNEFLFPSLKIIETIHESTAIRWLKKLGYNVSRVQKGVYVDGHERRDVVAARNEFISYIEREVHPSANTYDGDNMEETPPTLPPGGKVHYPIFHDETCVHANDLANYVWMREGEQPLRNKSRGRIVHVSDFIIEASGRLYLTPDEIEQQMKLPPRPNPPSSVSADPSNAHEEGGSIDQSAGPKKKKGRKASTKKTAASTTGRTFMEQENEWIPPPPPAPFKSYRLSSFDARRIIYPGANHDPWWDMPQLIAQTKDAIEIFDTKFPNGVAVFIFDCSSAHEAFASDALLAHKMNRNPGGKQPVMHDTYIPSTGEHQSMVYPLDFSGVDAEGNSLAGKPKGMEQVLRERNLLSVLDKSSRGQGNYLAVCADCKKSQAAREAALKEARSKQDEVEGSGVSALNARGVSDTDDDDHHRSKTCCMQRVLSLEKDFMEEKPLLQLIIERAGHKCLFLPKFHCELNPIEMVWGQAKRTFRGLADGSFKKAQELVPKCLDEVSLVTIRKYFRHCWRYMSAYSHGLNLKQAAYAVRKYTSHRRVPRSILMDVEVITRGLNG